MVELSTGEKGTMLSATPSHVQEQAMFLKREGDRHTHARTSGKHPTQSRARLAVKKWEEAEPL